VSDHINYGKTDRWLSYRTYGALQRLKSPMCYNCEIFGASRFSRYFKTICHQETYAPQQSAADSITSWCHRTTTALPHGDYHGSTVGTFCVARRLIAAALLARDPAAVSFRPRIFCGARP
jgi:hypothetical protein